LRRVQIKHNKVQKRIVAFIRSPKRKRLIWGLIVVIAIGGIFCLAFSFDLFHSVQLQSSDFFFKATSANSSAEPDKKILIVAVDDKSLEQLGRFSSWPRSYYVQVLDQLAKMETRVVAFDVLFSDSDPDNAMLSDAIKNAGNVILPVVKTDMQKNPTIIGSAVQSSGFIQPNADLIKNAVALGHVNVFADADGIVRRLPIVVDDGTETEPALCLAVLAKYLRRPAIVESPIIDNTLTIAGRTIPLDDNNRMTINYSLPLSYDNVSFVDVLQGNIDPQIYQDKIVLIGATATGLGDYFWTPTGSKINGVEIHADAINTLMSNSFLAPASKNLELACIMVLSLICGLLVLRLRVIWATLSALGICAIFLIVVFVCFDQGVVLNSTFPLMGIVGTFVGVNLYKLAAEQEQRNAITRTFGRYVSPSVASNVIQSLENGQLDLGGKEQEITVAFADVRGFTSLSENTPPPELVKALNKYLSVVIKAVLDNGGMINKFAGDSVMAIWNAPFNLANHPLMAVKAALQMQKGISELQEENPTLLRMEFGIGINTGRAVAGNMGSDDRTEYSIIGDAVNTSSRICDQTPKGKVWIGENTYLATKDNVVIVPVQAVEVKGKRDLVKVYEAVGIKTGIQAQSRNEGEKPPR
jgi:adenylate cyclase